MANINDAFGVESAIEFEEPGIFLITGTNSPLVGVGQSAPVGSLYVDSTNKTILFKTNTGDTDWTTVVRTDAPGGTVLISSSDTVGNYLTNKLLVSAPLAKQINSPGSNESLTLSVQDNPTFSGVEGLTVPVGTTAQRPSSPNAGQQRFNASNGVMEYWNGTEWTVNANQNAFSASFAPTGFVDRTQSVLSADSPTRTFTITPAGASYDIYVAGKKYTKTTAESVVFPNSPGFLMISFDTNGQLRADVGSIPVFSETAPIALINYNPLNPIVGIEEFRYGLSMDWSTRQNLYYNQGIQWVEGFDLIGFTTSGTGSSDTDAQISLTDCTIAVQDILINIQNGTPGSNFQEILNGPAELPIVYRDVSQYNFVSVPATTFPVLFGTNTIVYNQNNAGTWSAQDATDGYYVAMWVLSQPLAISPALMLMGIRQDSTLSQCITNNKFADVLIPGSQFTARPMYCLYFQADSTYTNSIKARLVGFTDYRGVNVANPITSHSILNDLGRDDHFQYVANNIARVITAQHTFAPIADQAPFVLGTHAQNQLVTGFNADKLDGLDSSAFQPIDSDLTALSTISGSGSGIYVITGVGTSAVRTITGTTNQITVSNGSGVSGNPVISISSDPVLSGTGSLTLPSGTSLQRPGSPASGMLRYNSTLQALEYYASSVWIQTGQQPFTDSTFPQGFVNITDSTLSFVNGTRTFTITPTSSQYVYYYGGVRRIKTSSDSVTIGNTSGSWWVYFDASDTLQASQTYPNLATCVTVATFYFNATFQVIFGINELRHGVSMDWSTRKFIHDTSGPKLISGFDLINYTLTGTGSADADAQIGLTNGAIAVEDLEFSVTNTTTPTVFLDAILSPVAKMSTSYRVGNDWIGSAATFFPLKFGTTRAQYNKNTAGTWSLADASVDDNFVATWIITAGSYSGPMAVIIGQREDTTLVDAKNNNTLETLDIGNFTNTDVKFLYRLIFQTNSSFTNAVKSTLVDVLDVRSVSTAQVILSGSGGTISHSSLSNLGNDDHLQYVHISNARTITAQHTFDPISVQPAFVLGTNAQGQQINGLNADLLDGYHASDFQLVDSDLTALANTNTTGLYAVTGTGTSATRTLTAPAAGFTITDGNGVSGNPTFVLANDLQAIEALSTTGFSVRTATDTWSTRSLVAPTAGFTISNNDGVSGNPTFALSDDLAVIEALSSTGIAVRTGSNAWSTRTISGTASQISVANGDGVSGNPVLSIASNPVIPGTQALTLPSGSTAQQGTASAGMVRFNTTNSIIEGYDGSTWLDLTKQGTVTSVSISTPAFLSVSGSPITTSGTLTLSLANQNANVIFAGPATGSAAAPTFRSFVNNDLPTSGVTASTYNNVTVNDRGIVIGGSNVSYLTGNQTITLSGDVAGSGTTSISTTLATVNANVGSFGTNTNVATFTVNGKGLITAASNTPITFPVTSVAGKTGAVTLTNSDVGLSNVTNSLQVVNAGNTPSISQGILSSRPAAGTSGRLYYSTDTFAISRDNGTTWDSVAPAYSGDASSAAGSLTLTLATVNSNVGSFGSATQVATFTVNGKGLITAANNTAITFPVTSVNGATGVVVLTKTDVGLSNLVNSLQVINAGGAVSITEDTAVNRPAAGTAGRIFFDTTNSLIQRDTGAAWVTFGAPGTVTSVAISSSDITVGSSPITTSGTITLTLPTVNSNVGTFNNLTVNGKGLVTAASNVSYLTGNQTITLSGDITGSGTTAITGTLATVNSNVGSFGTATQVPSFTVNGKGLITAASNVAITFPVTSVGGTSPVVSSGGATPSISLAAGYGDTQNPYASKTANFFLAAPNGASGVPTFRAIVATDIPTLNQNTTGSAGSVTNSVTFNNGGAGGASGSTFNGGSALTVSYNSIGASPLAGSSSLTTTGVVTSGTWSSLISGETYSTSATVTAGTNAQGQGALTSDYNVVTTTANNPSGVTLPTATVGRRIIVVNKGTNPVSVYPVTGAAIDALSTNAALTLPVGAWIEFDASSTTQWYSTVNVAVNSSALIGTISNAQLANSSVTINGSTVSLGGSTTITANTTNALTINNSGAGVASGSTFNGGSAVTISYNSVGASPLAGSASLTTVGTITSGTWNGTTIAIANGGTGQITAAAGFNALSPITTTGDLIVGNGTNSATRLGIGTANQVLTSTGTTAAWTTAKTIRQLLTGAIAQATGTTTIPFDNTTPLSTEGTQIWTQNITPISTGSVIQITFSLMVDHNTQARGVTVTVFRGTTLIDVHTTWNSAASIGGSIGPMCVSFEIHDSPATTSAVTYSARIGGTGSGTWYASRSQTATYNGQTSQYCLKELL